jgi:serine phosphatase RsbU (regulator of sigma subunit)
LSTDERDSTAGERDTAAGERDSTADERDTTADERDTAADERDTAAEKREQADGLPDSEHVNAARDRESSARDRESSARDRHKGLGEREGAADDRLRAAEDRAHAVLAALTGALRLEAAEREMMDLRAIRDVLTPPDLPQRPGLELASAFLPAEAERVSGDFYVVAEGPQDATVLVVGDVVGHGLDAARRAAFVRTAFVATSPYSDDPCQLLDWVNASLIERAGTNDAFVTAACVTYLPGERCLRWAYAGHPEALWLDDGTPLVAPQHGAPLGIDQALGCVEGSSRLGGDVGILLYTDGLTEARHSGELFGEAAVSAVLGGLNAPSPAEAIAVLRARVTEFAYGGLTDDLCMLAARVQ